MERRRALQGLLLLGSALLPFASAACVEVSGSARCSELFPSSAALVNTDTLANATSVIDAATFDAWVDSSAENTLLSLNCGTLMDEAKSHKVSSVRFGVSFGCQQALQSGSTCGPQPAINDPSLKKLCQSTCGGFLSSVIETGVNTGLCRPDPTPLQNFLAFNATICGSLPADRLPADQTPCLRAVKAEIDFCGYPNTAEGRAQAQALCQTNSSLPCCNANDRVPLIAGLCGGGLFGIIAIVFSAYQYRNQRNRHRVDNAASRASSIHAHRAELGARSSHMWAPTGGPSSVSPGAYAAPKEEINSPYNSNSPQGFGYSQPNEYSRTHQAPSGAYGYQNGYQPPSTAEVRQSGLPSPRTPTTPSTPRQPTLGMGATRNGRPVSTRHSVRVDSYTAQRESRIAGTHRAMVLENYEPAGADEVRLRTGDVVHVQRVFDDGWGWGRNTSTGQEGAFPTVCLNNF
ncbi:uncharacterized protein EV422DRAFT_402101 [Fimicolochytrium jonesii]|uniref:uncharacterized protein n=1 Tax=Fimicolochytrium jonesii TaxID=1396493 RepID=UPI0022FDBBE0|nr:uncharacterized protein EV422DRAFT_402101 [Fimicolochytrium jonesii]KAI8822516.1 hypothetical protein EV422DRAFT_402101 [Fimicolochytrium jonesii]